MADQVNVAPRILVVGDSVTPVIVKDKPFDVSLASLAPVSRLLSVPHDGMINDTFIILQKSE